MLKLNNTVISKIWEIVKTNHSTVKRSLHEYSQPNYEGLTFPLFHIVGLTLWEPAPPTFSEVASAKLTLTSECVCIVCVCVCGVYVECVFFLPAPYLHRKRRTARPHPANLPRWGMWVITVNKLTQTFNYQPRTGGIFQAPLTLTYRLSPTK